MKSNSRFVCLNVVYVLHARVVIMLRPYEPDDETLSAYCFTCLAEW